MSEWLTCASQLSRNSYWQTGGNYQEALPKCHETVDWRCEWGDSEVRSSTLARTFCWMNAAATSTLIHYKYKAHKTRNIHDISNGLCRSLIGLLSKERFRDGEICQSTQWQAPSFVCVCDKPAVFQCRQIAGRNNPSQQDQVVDRLRPSTPDHACLSTQSHITHVFQHNHKSPTSFYTFTHHLNFLNPNHKTRPWTYLTQL